MGEWKQNRKIVIPRTSKTTTSGVMGQAATRETDCTGAEATRHGKGRTPHMFSLDCFPPAIQCDILCELK
jgi:hypothetical protein